MKMVNTPLLKPTTLEIIQTMYENPDTQFLKGDVAEEAGISRASGYNVDWDWLVDHRVINEVSEGEQHNTYEINTDSQIAINVINLNEAIQEVQR